MRGAEVRDGGELPLLDVHALVVPAPRGPVWRAVEEVAASLGVPGSPLGRLLAAALGTRPARGFAVAVREPERRLTLTGAHRFARYAIVLDLADDAAGTRVSLTSRAAFPGVRGAAYRALVVGSRGHVVAVRRILRGIHARALRGSHG